MISSSCPLCLQPDSQPYAESPTRTYLRCAHCHLIFVPPHQHLDQRAEKAIYDQHQNNPNDADYRHFLNKLAAPLQKYLQPGMKGLDFGCGPGPTLSVMLTERGFDMAIFDPYYANAPEVLSGHYDFITATEVVEHLAQPGRVFTQLFELLPAIGVLGLMTSLVPEDRDFLTWHYQNDPTHIAFYARHSFLWLAEHYGREVEFVGNDVILFRPRNEKKIQRVSSGSE